MKIKQLTNLKVYDIDKIIKREFPHTTNKENNFHVKKGISLYAYDEKGLVSFMLALNYKTHSSLTLFYISKRHRHGKKAFFFFMHAITKLQKPIYLRTDDVSKYKSITKKYQGDIYELDLKEKEKNSLKYLHE